MFWYLTNTGRSGDGIVTLEVMERECGDSVSCSIVYQNRIIAYNIRYDSIKCLVALSKWT